MSDPSGSPAASPGASSWLSVDIRHRVAPAPGALSLNARFTLASRPSHGWTVLFGPSGSGKSTLLRAIAGLIRPGSGQIHLFSAPVLYSGSAYPHQLDIPPRHRRIALVPRQPSLFPHLDAAANVAFGLRHLDAAAKQTRVSEFLSLFRADHLAHRLPISLSSGEQQRVALARALAPHPRALLLDEPFSALDMPTRTAILADLQPWLTTHRIPVLYVTHDLGELFTIAAEALLIDAGSIRAQGDPKVILASERASLLAALSGSQS